MIFTVLQAFNTQSQGLLEKWHTLPQISAAYRERQSKCIAVLHSFQIFI